jgi:hypothetical protein
MDNSNPPRDILRPTTDNDWSYHIINIIILVGFVIYIHIQFFCILIILYVHIQFFGQCILIIL